MSLIDKEFRYRLNRVLLAFSRFDRYKASSVRDFPAWVYVLYDELRDLYGTDVISPYIPEVIGLPRSARAVFEAFLVKKAQDAPPLEELADTSIEAPAEQQPEDSQPAEQQSQDLVDSLLSQMISQDNKGFPGESNPTLNYDIQTYLQEHPTASPEEIYDWLVDPLRENSWSEPYLLSLFDSTKETVLKFIEKKIRELGQNEAE